ncbi:hypothetical protein ACJ41P_10545 [Azospirillum argentinense]|uniref:Uncharacterized protein n=1 Tax=Azospirillum argentinense TaxID=2970906 RepID=A0ABW8VAS5_9PROT
MSQYRSMQSTLAKLDKLPIRTAADISSSNYQIGYTAGLRSAYRRMGWIAAAFVLAGALTALWAS